MRQDRKSLRLVPLTVVAAGLLLGGCSSFNLGLPSFSGAVRTTPPPPPAGAALPSKYAPEEVVGRWGLAAYQERPDRARTEHRAQPVQAPYVIAKGPAGGVIMHLADQRQPTELRLKGSPERQELHRAGRRRPAYRRTGKSSPSTAGCWSPARSIPKPPTATATWSTCAARPGLKRRRRP